MEQQVIYHRTFLPDGPYVGGPCQHQCHPQRTRSPQPHGLQFDPELFGATESQPLGVGPFANMPVPPVSRNLSLRREPYQPDQMRHRVRQWTGSQLAKIWVVRKADQRLEEFATDWERRHSRIVFSADGNHGRFEQFDAVVDHNLMLVAHLGRVNGHQLIIPDGVAMMTYHLQRNLDQGIPVYVGREQPGWSYFSASEELYDVLIGVDGEVLACLGTDVVGLESVDFSPLDIIEMATGVAALGRLVTKRIVKSLARRAARRSSQRLLVGPTRELAERAVRQQVSHGIRPPTMIDYVPQSGMTRNHYSAFRQASREQQVIAVVRNTNPNSTRLIEMGCPGKPLHFKFNTDPQTGIVMASEVEHVEKAWQHGYYVVDANGVAKRRLPGRFQNGQPVFEELDLQGAFWKVSPGQVIEASTKKPVVGDYDLMGVIDPKSPGRNIALMTDGGEILEDVNSPIVRRFAEAVNGKMDRPRVLHGAQDQFGGFRKGAIAFFPDGRVLPMQTEDEVRMLYQQLGRQPHQGAYAQPDFTGPVRDELAERQARKAIAQP